jgi:hypothetical protein
MQEVEKDLEYSLPSRALATLGLLIVPPITLVILAAGVWGIANGDGLWRKSQGMIVLLTGFYMCYALREWIRGWHAYRTTYIVGNTGVKVIERGKQPRQLSWEEFYLGVNKRLLPAVVLFSSQGEKPVFLFNNGMHGISREYEQVRDLAVRKLGDRMRTRWL